MGMGGKKDSSGKPPAKVGFNFDNLKNQFEVNLKKQVTDNMVQIYTEKMKNEKDPRKKMMLYNEYQESIRKGNTEKKIAQKSAE